MPARRLRMCAPLLIALLGLTACATPESQPADQDLVDDDGSDPFLDEEDAEGLPENDQFEDDAEEPATADGEALTLDVATSEEYGDYLVDGDGLALYVSATDPPGESTCTDTCVQEWPILSVGEEPTVADGIDEELVGTLERDDQGEDEFMQVTFRDKPLHYHQLDQDPDMTTGQGTDDNWFLIGPDGVEIRD